MFQALCAIAAVKVTLPIQITRDWKELFHLRATPSRFTGEDI
jgi:hypothetical protein